MLTNYVCTKVNNKVEHQQQSRTECNGSIIREHITTCITRVFFMRNKTAHTITH